MFTYKCTVKRVVDGDTLDLILDLGFHTFIHERVRLYGINTPEVYGRNTSEEGKAASEFVKNWVIENSKSGVFVYTSLKYDARDKYGRSLGVLSWQSEDGNTHVSLNTLLISEGYATVY